MSVKNVKILEMSDFGNTAFGAMLVLLFMTNAPKIIRYCILNGSFGEWSVKRSVSGDDGAFATMKDGICRANGTVENSKSDQKRLVTFRRIQYCPMLRTKTNRSVIGF